MSRRLPLFSSAADDNDDDEFLPDDEDDGGEELEDLFRTAADDDEDDEMDEDEDDGEEVRIEVDDFLERASNAQAAQQTNAANDAPSPLLRGGAASLQDLLQTVLSAPGGPSPNILALLRRSGIRVVLRRPNDDDEEPEDNEDDGFGGLLSAPQPRRSRQPYYDPIEGPQEAGLQLLRSGEFGRLRPLLETSNSKGPKRSLSLGQKLRQSKLSRRHVVREDFTRSLVPNSLGTIVAQYHANPYSGQYSEDSSFYYTCSQDFKLHIYDTTSPPIMDGDRVTTDPQANHPTTMKVIKSVDGVGGGWTIADSHLSPDNERMIYSALDTQIHMVKTRDTMNEQVTLEMADTDRGYRRSRFGDDFRLFACRFSADGNEIVSGGSGQLFVYDLLAMKRTTKIAAHDDDVNSCCWADTASGNVLISASDDTFLKVWDRRSLDSHAIPAGVLVGHTEGITSVSPKGDGRYVVSNGKDQTMRLWDLRKMRSFSEFEAMPQRSYGVEGYDYRYGDYRRPKFAAHPRDCSVMAYRGHQVFRTLIRCHFSPQETTGGSYLYTGSSDGKIHIYSLDGQIVQVIDRSKALPISFDPSEPEPPQEGRNGVSGGHTFSRAGVVRDVSWHSREPVMMSVGWGAGSYGMGGGNVARHEWKGLGKNGMKLEDVVEKDKVESESRSRNIVPGAFPSDD